MGLNTHQTRRHYTSDDWITPREFITEFGPFDLDPCASATQPWPCAERSYTCHDDGLTLDWTGIVWLNPPYGRQLGAWLERLANHGNGMAFTFVRTDTNAFHRFVWGRANGIFFLRGRPYFYRPDGTRATANSGCAMCLIAYGQECDARLRRTNFRGKYLTIYGSKIKGPFGGDSTT